jgi:hypothetical protein
MDEYFEFLNDLRDYGVCNMFGAGPILAEAFSLDNYKAKEILLLWMESYSAGQPE